MSATESVQERLQTAEAEVRKLKQKLEERKAGFETKPPPLELFHRRSERNLDVERMQTLHADPRKVYSIDWAGSSSILLSIGQAGQLIVWNAAKAQKQSLVLQKNYWTLACTFESDTDRLIATGGLNNSCSVYAFDARALRIQEPAVHEFVYHTGYISSCCFLSGSSLVIGSGDKRCSVWDVEKGERMNAFPGHSGDITSVHSCPVDPNVFASGSCDSTVKIWDCRAGTNVLTFSSSEAELNSVRYMRNGFVIATGGEDGICSLIDIRSCSRINEFGGESSSSAIKSVDFSKSGRFVFAGYDSKECAVMDCFDPEWAPKYYLMGHTDCISDVKVNSEGTALATASWDGTIMIHA
eukprot:gb/GECG01001899.1/.p1 GENE.gb/GECG01001899.1/~~gb/GECG01001899.1/.p1  ORF type:complete len:354 (+),score=41.80 gb/GECG01001899.1/:1-1062(+)